MFYYINGVVSVMEAQMTVIDCGGVGFACFTTSNTQSRLTIGKIAKLYTYVNVKEDAFDIYGFYTQKELNGFKLLLGVSGVGPKAALAILSYVSVEELAAAIMIGNEKTLTTIPGIGKKLAQRILLELKDKFTSQEQETDMGMTNNPSDSTSSTNGKLAEVQAALAALGYSSSDIASVMKGIKIEELTVEDILRQALKRSLN